MKRTRFERRIVPLFALALCACATPTVPLRLVEIPPPRLAPAPPDVMVERPANFRQRLLDFFSSSPATPTTSPGNSPPASGW